MPEQKIDQKQEQEKPQIKEMGIYERLSHIQNEMNVPKNLFNKFGNYYYRNAETIMETAKPICAKYRTTLLVTDEIECVDSRHYVKSVARLISWDDEAMIMNVAYAREDELKKGMDGAQVTGSTSSYARKYALNGLFNLDDVKDSDTTEQKVESEEKEKLKKSEPKQASQPQKKLDRHEVLSKVRGFEETCEKVGVNIYSEVNKAFIRSEIGEFTDISKLDDTKLIKYGNILISMINGKLAQQKNGKES